MLAFGAQALGYFRVVGLGYWGFGFRVSGILLGFFGLGFRGGLATQTTPHHLQQQPQQQQRQRSTTNILIVLIITTIGNAIDMQAPHQLSSCPRRTWSTPLLSQSHTLAVILVTTNAFMNHNSSSSSSSSSSSKTNTKPRASGYHQQRHLQLHVPVLFYCPI